MARIINYGLPETFDPDFVPDEAHAFMREIAGMDLMKAYRLAMDRGFEPYVKPLKQSSQCWGFSLCMDFLEIPFVVWVEDEKSTALKLTFENLPGGVRVLSQPNPEALVAKMKAGAPLDNAEILLFIAWREVVHYCRDREATHKPH